MTLNRKIAATVAGTALVLGLTGSARAALMLTLSEPTMPTLAPVQVTEDVNNPGTVTYFLPYGDFTTNIIVGYSNRTTPTGTMSTLQIQSLEVTNRTGGTAAKTLVITLSDNGFTFPVTTGNGLTLTSGIAGTLVGQSAGDTVRFTSTATPLGGTPVTTPTQTYTAAVASPAGVTVSPTPTTATFTFGTSYALSDVTTITLSGAGTTANLSGSTTATTPVPEPASAGLAAVGAGALALRRRRHRA